MSLGNIEQSVYQNLCSLPWDRTHDQFPPMESTWKWWFTVAQFLLFYFCMYWLCVCAYTNGHMHVEVRGQRECPLLLYTLCFEAGPATEPGAHSGLHWLSRDLWGAVSRPSSTRATHACHHSWSWHRSLGSKSRPLRLYHRHFAVLPVSPHPSSPDLNMDGPCPQTFSLLFEWI